MSGHLICLDTEPKLFPSYFKSFIIMTDIISPTSTVHKYLLISLLSAE